MTGFELMHFLLKQDTDVLRSDVFAGLNDEDMIVDAYVTNDGFVSLLTEQQRQMDAEEQDEQDDNYWEIKSDEWLYDDYVQERIRRERRGI